MLPHDELYHYGVLGMKWGVRKDAQTRLLNSQKKADLAKLNIEIHDAKKRLRNAGNNVDRTDKDAVKRFKLERKALQAEIKAKRMAIKVRKAQTSMNTPAEKVFNRDDRGSNNRDRNNGRREFESKFQNPSFAKNINDKPMSSLPRDGVFKRALTEAAIKGAGSAASTAASKLIEPTSNAYGVKFVEYLTSTPYTNKKVNAK